MNRAKASRRTRGDEPDAFRRAIERWTLRMLLIIVTVVLAFELVAWAAQKIRRCTHEIMDDADTQVLNSLPVRANRADDSHVRDPEGRGRHLHGSSAEPANEIFSGEQVQLEISPPSR